MTKSQLWSLIGIFLIAAALRLGSLPHQPFFCDVPANVAAVETGTMIGNAFPGYAPFHWMIRLTGDLTGSPFSGDILFNLLCGLGAMLYCILFAYDRGGFHGALLTSVLIGFSPIALYFSTVGASYGTDLLGMSAVLYHGNRALAAKSDRDFRWAVVWFSFSCVMRPLSFAFAFPGILYVLWTLKTWKNFLFTAIVLTIGAVLYGSITLRYYGSLAAVQNSFAAPQGAALHPLTLSWIGANEVRYALFLIWSLNFFVLVVPLVLWQARRSINWPLAAFIFLLSFPYACLMAWYIPHAGYVCLLLPALICAPWAAENRLWLETRCQLLAAAFAVLSLLQFFGARPIPFKGTPSLVLNTYVLTYTHRGIERGMFGNYQQWLAWMQGKVLDIPARGTDE